MPQPHGYLRYLRKVYSYFASYAYPADLRQVSLIDGLISVEEAHFLYSLAATVTAGCIVEVGSYRGRSTAALALGSMGGHFVPVYAVEPHERFIGYYGGQFGPEDRAAFFRAMLQTKAYRVVRLLNTTSATVAPNWPQKISLLFIDGDHTYDGVKADWDQWSRHLLPSASVIFDDSLDLDCGPAQLIRELDEKNLYKTEEVVGKLTRLSKVVKQPLPHLED